MTRKIIILQNYRFLILAAIMLVSAFLLENKTGIADIKRINTSLIQSVLNDRYLRTQESLDEISSLLNNEGYALFFEKHADRYNELYQKEGIVLLAYHEGELVFWNSNILPLQIDDTLLKDTHRMVNPGNGWYVTLRQSSGDTLNLIGLILIRHDYVFENQFLVNDFYPGFGMYPEAEIELFPDGPNIIKDPEGNFLFSIAEPYPPAVSPAISRTAALMYLMSIVFLLLFFYRSLNLVPPKFKNVWLAGIILFLIAARYLMLETGTPALFSQFTLFQPQLYAKSSLFPSLGDFLINASIIFFAVTCFHTHFRLPGRKTGKARGTAIVLIMTALLAGYMILLDYLFEGLIINSNIQLEVSNFVYLSQYSLIAYLILAMLLASLVLLTDKVADISSMHGGVALFIPIFTASLVASMILFMHLDIFSIAFFLLLTASIAAIRFSNSRYTYSFQIFLVFLVSLFTLAFVTTKSSEKERDIMQVLAVNLANERDQVAEFLLKDTEDNLRADQFVRTLITSPHHTDHDIFDYLQENHFSGYFRKYDLQVATCTDYTDLHLADVDVLVDCYSFFYAMADEFGIPVFPGSAFYFLDNLIGRISYLGMIRYEIDEYPHEKTMFLSLDSRIMDTQLGYPELLIEGYLAGNQPITRYSYAKYVNEQLITRSGSYMYPLNLHPTYQSPDEFTYSESGGYEHLVYHVDPGNVIILSKPTVTAVDLLTSFSYNVVFFYIVYSLSLLVCKYPFNLRRWRINFKNKIKFSMIAVLLLSLLTIGAGTIYYNISQFENRQYENIGEKIQSVLIDLEYRLGMEPDLTPDMQQYITGTLVQLSNIFHTDINLYDGKGILYASSRPEVFELGLIGEQMNPEAYSEMLLRNNMQFIHKESIGELSYLSAYVPLFNADNEILSYINLPYFTRHSILQKEIYTLVVAVVNIYAILILITIIIAVIVSNTITKPLRLIQNKLRKLSIVKKNEQIEYESDDEIGSLIREYNRMVGELENSADLLAKSERESAWREMAKQIAHEIKNPLTPMKLSIQHLQRSWDDRVENWDELFKKTTRHLIEQIDHLSSIATAFSNFAKMPRPVTSEADIVGAITSAAGLFANNKNIQISVFLHGVQELHVFADKMQLNRIFINLLKNSVQSIPKDRHGKISIELLKEPEAVLVKVCDNGAGIPEETRKKMFTPYFTTKSGGTGLGLAIVKSIVEQSGGSVGFTSEYGKGSCFYFRLPYAGSQDRPQIT